MSTESVHFSTLDAETETELRSTSKCNRLYLKGGVGHNRESIWNRDDKTGPILEVCNSCIWWQRKTIHMSKCLVLYREWTSVLNFITIILKPYYAEILRINHSPIPDSVNQLFGCLVLLRLPRTLCSARRLSVCLSVSNYRTDLHENFTTDVSVHKEELIKFWKSSASRSGSRIF